jgi:hypothetical protein
MKNEGCGDTCRNGEDSAPPPVRENAKGKYHQDSQCDDFDRDGSHGLTLPCEALPPEPGDYRIARGMPPAVAINRL